MLNFKNITVGYSGRVLLNNTSLQLYSGQKVGLVGNNGVGKTTLLQLILGNIHSDAGDFSLPANTLISYIEQEIEAPDTQLLEYVLLANPHYREKHIDLPIFYQLPSQAEKLLINLGFSPSELQKPLHEFSGGWQMRANLAKALFNPSELLLLDEPTNHLDIETVLWLEDWLSRYNGLAIIISHDREFLDNVTTHTVAIYNQQLNLFSGNYSRYQQTRSEQEELQRKVAERTQAKINHLQSFVDRFKAKASKAKQAQSRMKMIEKLQVSNVVSNERDYSIEFFAPDYVSNKLLTITDATIGYGDKVLINDAKLQIFAHDRIGLLGKNGKGKTSLIKAILDGGSLLAGTIEINPKLKIGYFAQHSIDQLESGDTPFDYIQRQNKPMTTQEVYNYLGRFGFSAEISSNSLKNFSGGEKSRLVLAGIILTKPNILFLDEPTNHLDMAMREELALSLQDYGGAVVLVSHDQFLLDAVVDDFYWIENNQLQIFDGDLSDYQKYLLQKEVITDSTPAAPSLSAPPAAASTGNNSERRKQSAKIRQQISLSEKKMQQLTSAISLINAELVDPKIMQPENLVKYSTLLEELNVAQAQLENEELQWLGLQEQLEQLG